MTEQELILTSILNCRRVDLYTEPIELDSDQKALYEQLKLRLDLGEPIQYILGSCEFYGIPLKVDPRVLIPRPETEVLVDIALQQVQLYSQKNYLRILDIGTGSGNIAVALAKHLSQSYVVTVDRSLEALDLARGNAKDNGVEHRVDFVNLDCEAFLRDQVLQRKKFDVVISNPPYIPTSKLSQLPFNVQHEPKLALDGGHDGLFFYRMIIPQSFELLNEGGFLFLEIGDGQSFDILDIFKKGAKDFNFKDVKILKDLAGADRFILSQR